MATATQDPATAGKQDDDQVQAHSDPGPDPAAGPVAGDGTGYVVLARQGGDTPWREMGTVQAPGQEAAKRKLAADDPTVQQLLTAGEAVQLVAVPVRSWHVTTVQLEQPKPRLKLS